jgi:hypothetical protein
MKTHIDCVHPKLLVAMKKQLTKVIFLYHTHQLVKKRVGIISNLHENLLPLGRELRPQRPK